ncbi:MAG: Gfo/Idh/MocA family protein [Galactobacter sp.]
MDIAVFGAGLIGRQHLTRLVANPRVGRVLVVDPVIATTADLPEHLQQHVEPTTAAAALDSAHGVILATPNPLHRDGALAAIDAGLPVLVEKPLADTEAAALEIVRAADAANVSVLTGHHRRHSTTLRAAREAVAQGLLGHVLAVQASALFPKPSAYFTDAPWRARRGGGPLLINLVHDADALRWLVGEVTSVRAVASNRARGFEVEDTAALILRFANGALGTFLLSDAVASHRSWEQTSGENPSYDRDPQADCYHLAGTTGSLDVPTLRLSTAQGAAHGTTQAEPSWWEPAAHSRLDAQANDPLTAQLEHFLDIVEHRAAPRVTARDGLQSLRIVLAAAQSAAAGGDEVGVAPPPAVGH